VFFALLLAAAQRFTTNDAACFLAELMDQTK
jgi:hypothetical protein